MNGENLRKTLLVINAIILSIIGGIGSVVTDPGTANLVKFILWVVSQAISTILFQWDPRQREAYQAIPQEAPPAVRPPAAQNATQTGVV